MSDLLEGPPRLKEQYDQTNLAERIAGQVARNLPAPRLLSEPALARIASRIDWDGPAAQPHHRGSWVFATVAFLLGVGTTASAMHLDILRTWLAGTVRQESRFELHQHASPVVAKRTPAAAEGQAVQEEPASQALAEPPPALDPSQSGPSARPEAPPRLAEPQPELSARLGEGQAVPTRAPGNTRTNRKPSFAKEAHAGSAPTARTASSPLAMPPSPATTSQPLSPPPGAPLPLLPLVTPPNTVDKTAAPAEGSAAGVNAPLAYVDRHQAPVSPPPIETKPTNQTPSPTEQPSPAKPTPSASDAQNASKYLTQAMQAFRVGHSPKTALSILDSHATELAKAAFAHEATLLRVDVLLALRRPTEALRLLDGMSLTAVPASWTLLVTRGELRAAINRCAEGIGDFDLVLAQAGRPPKRALFGRAICRQRLGDRAGAAADIERYRREFPGDARINDLDKPGVASPTP
jgi:hypothetical protein